MAPANTFALFSTSIDEELKDLLDENSERLDLPFFRVLKYNVIERMSHPFEATVTVESDSAKVNIESLLSVSASLKLVFDGEPRYFNGQIGHVKQLKSYTTKDAHRVTSYEIKFYPQFWFMQYNKDYRVFQDQKTLDIVSIIFKNHNLTEYYFPKKLDEYRRPYCVQYGESAYHFISRLLEEDGIAYFFDHQPSKTIMQLSATKHDYLECLTNEKVMLRDNMAEGDELNTIYHISTEVQTIPSSFVSIGYNYEQASIPLFTYVESQGIGGRVASYPSRSENQETVDMHTELRRDSQETAKEIIRGEGCLPFFAPGFYFTMKGHSNENLNEVNYTLEKVQHKGEISPSEYVTTFSAFKTEMPYMPHRKTPKPRIHGTQTAVVVGPQGEEVWTDELCRVQIRFHWDIPRKEEGTRKERPQFAKVKHHKGPAPASGEVRYEEESPRVTSAISPPRTHGELELEMADLSAAGGATLKEGEGAHPTPDWEEEYDQTAVLDDSYVGEMEDDPFSKPGFYDADGNYHVYGANGYYDAEGNFHSYAPDGYYDSERNYYPDGGNGYYDPEGNYHPFGEDGYYDPDGNFHPYGDYDQSEEGNGNEHSEEGYYDDEGYYHRHGEEGYYDAEGNYFEDNESSQTTSNDQQNENQSSDVEWYEGSDGRDTQEKDQDSSGSRTAAAGLAGAGIGASAAGEATQAGAGGDGSKNTSGGEASKSGNAQDGSKSGGRGGRSSSLRGSKESSSQQQTGEDPNRQSSSQEKKDNERNRAAQKKDSDARSQDTKKHTEQHGAQKNMVEGSQDPQNYTGDADRNQTAQYGNNEHIDGSGSDYTNNADDFLQSSGYSGQYSSSQGIGSGEGVGSYDDNYQDGDIGASGEMGENSAGGLGDQRSDQNVWGMEEGAPYGSYVSGSGLDTLKDYTSDDVDNFSKDSLYIPQRNAFSESLYEPTHITSVNDYNASYNAHSFVGNPPQQQAFSIERQPTASLQLHAPNVIQNQKVTMVTEWNPNYWDKWS